MGETGFEPAPLWSQTTMGAISTLIQYGLTANAQEDLDGVLYLRISDIDDDGNVNLANAKYVARDMLGKGLISVSVNTKIALEQARKASH